VSDAEFPHPGFCIVSFANCKLPFSSSRARLSRVSMKQASKSSPAAVPLGTDKQGTLVQVARLYYEEGLSQQEVADRLGVSRSLIALYLNNAREAGIVRVRIVDPTNACTSLADSLKKLTGLGHITVIPNPRGALSLSQSAVAGAAAAYLAETLNDGDTLGLAWGRTTSLVADREGFEPSVTLLPHTLSKRAHSTTLTPALGGRDARSLVLGLQSLFWEP